METNDKAKGLVEVITQVSQQIAGNTTKGNLSFLIGSIVNLDLINGRARVNFSQENQINYGKEQEITDVGIKTEEDLKIGDTVVVVYLNTISNAFIICKYTTDYYSNTIKNKGNQIIEGMKYFFDLKAKQAVFDNAQVTDLKAINGTFTKIDSDNIDGKRIQSDFATIKNLIVTAGSSSPGGSFVNVATLSRLFGAMGCKYDTLFEGDASSGDIELAYDWTNYDFIITLTTNDDGNNIFHTIISTWLLQQEISIQTEAGKQGIYVSVGSGQYWIISTLSTGTLWKVSTENSRMKKIMGVKMGENVV